MLDKSPQSNIPSNKGKVLLERENGDLRTVQYGDRFFTINDESCLNDPDQLINDQSSLGDSIHYMGSESTCDGDTSHTPSKKDVGALLDSIQLSLDLAGFIPLLGAVPDLVNALISVCRGDMVGASLSALAAIPLYGDFVAIGKVAKDARKVAKLTKGTTLVGKEINHSSKLDRVFWSGGEEAKEAARKFAKEHGMTILEDTNAGKHLEKRLEKKRNDYIHKNLSKKKKDFIERGYSEKEWDGHLKSKIETKLKTRFWNQVEKKQWVRLSSHYAKGTENEVVHIFRTYVTKDSQGNIIRDYRKGSVWRTHESIILKEKGKTFHIHLVKNAAWKEMIP